MTIQGCSNDRHGHRLELRVYYEDTDAGGIVYHANYLKFAERARTEMMRTLGADHGELHRKSGLTFVVRRCLVDYRRPARLDDALEVWTRIVRLGGASLDLRQEVCRDDDLLVVLDVRLALLNAAHKPARFPSTLIAALLPQYKDRR